MLGKTPDTLGDVSVAFFHFHSTVNLNNETVFSKNLLKYFLIKYLLKKRLDLRYFI